MTRAGTNHSLSFNAIAFYLDIGGMMGPTDVAGCGFAKPADLFVDMLAKEGY